MALLLSIGGHAALIASQSRDWSTTLAALPAKQRLLLPARVMGVELVRPRPAVQPTPDPTAPAPEPVANNDIVIGSDRAGALDANPAPDSNRPSYYRISEIDQRPVPTTAIELDAVIGFGAPAGSAILRFWISASGKVDKVDIDESTFREDVALRLQRYAEQLSFIPGQYRGVPVPSTFRVEVKLQGSDGEAGIARAS